MNTELINVLNKHQRLQVSVWDPKDDAFEFHYNSFLIEARPPRLKVALPIEPAGHILPLLQPGLMIGIFLESYPTPYIFYPLIHDKPDDEGFWLNIPDDVKAEGFHIREHVRVRMFLPVEITYNLSPPQVLQGTTEDMSGGGLRFTTSRQFVLNEEISLRFRFHDDTPLLTVQAKVVHSSENRVRRSPRDLYATSCKFINLKEQEESLIMRECFRQELHRPL